MQVAEALYKKFELKRVFYSAFVSVNEDTNLPANRQEGAAPSKGTPIVSGGLASALLSFEAAELLDDKNPNFNVLLDPKCNWALKHLETFPVEINRADYLTLLRVPGIGYKSAERIVKARKFAVLDFADLKKIGVY